MKEISRRYCGLDVHRDSVVVCVLPPKGQPGSALRKRYGTFRNELIRLRVWLKQLQVTDIGLESTGVYWRPVWNVLEGHGFQLLLANPVQVKALQGYKSDQRDAQRIAEFLEDGRLRASFVPPLEIRQLRLLLRHRIALLEQRNEVHNQIRDLFETASLKLSSVVSDLLGLTGRGIIEALIRGEDSPERLSWKARGSLRRKEQQIRESLKGCFDEFHRTLLASLYKHYQFLSLEIDHFEQQIAAHLEPYAEQVQLLTTIPGVDRLVAWHLLAELGPDMSVFPDAPQCAAWAGVVPGENQSAGSSRSTRCRKGNRVLRRVLTQAAWAASHCKEGYLRAFFHRVKARRGWAKAIVATAHKILLIAYAILKQREPYRDLGHHYFDQLHPARTAKRLLTRLEALGLQVVVTPAPTSSSS